MTDGEITFFDYIGIILKHRKLITGVAFFAAIFALFYSIFFKSFYSAELKLWSDESSHTVEFLKSKEVLESVLDKFSSDVSAKGNVITFTVQASKPDIAVAVANKIAEKIIEQEAEFSSQVLENQKKAAENKWVFAFELFEKSSIKREIDLSGFPQISPNNPPFFYILNEPTLVSEASRTIIVAKNILFGILLGIFFGILFAFIREYALRHKGEWGETKRKYLNK